MNQRARSHAEISILTRFLLPFVLFSSAPSRAQTFQVLYSFGAGESQPYGSLLQAADGNFYGTTVSGGANDLGTIFTIDSSGNLTVLHSFSGADGADPFAGLIQASDGSFYGTASAGGTAGHGTIFRMDTSGNFTTLHSFSGPPYDGANPQTGVIQASDSKFYGTTLFGGTGSCTNGCGTVFRIDSSGNEMTLYSFSDSDGSTPRAGLIQALDGNFYGTTSNGGAGSGCTGNPCGTIFRIDSSGNLATLHRFAHSPSDGAAPFGNLIQASDGNFYGTTADGGTTLSPGTYGLGTVFRMEANGNLTVIHNFTGSDGTGPIAGLVQASDGNFYGTTLNGGIDAAGCFGGCGTIFKIDSAGSFTTLHSFSGADGIYPGGPLTQATDGMFYGTTTGGGTGTYNAGVVFRLTDSSCTAPAAPSSLLIDGGASATITAGQAYTLTWPDTLAAAGEPGQYEIKVSTDGGTSYLHVAYATGTSYQHTTLPSDGGHTYLFTVTAEPSCGPSGNSLPSNSVSLTVDPISGGGCTPNDTTLCLNGGRFEVVAQWSDFQGNTGFGHVVPYGSDTSGMMWFFGADNWEMLIKVLNGCPVNNHYWVLAALTTNVQYTIQVTDTQTGEVKTYANPLGNPAPAITDAAAFTSCP